MDAARILHLHPYDDSDAETLEAGSCAAALRAVREACPASRSRSAPRPRSSRTRSDGWS